MRIDENILTQARTADVLAFFEKYNGFTFANKSEEYRCRQHPSLVVKHDRLSWFWHSKGIGGYGVLDYLVRIENMPFRQAVEVITDTTPTTAKPQQEVEKPKSLMLPEKRNVALRIHEYLCLKRGIDSNIVNTLIQKEMLYEDRRGNVVFVGYDERNKPRFASLRRTHGDCSFRGDCARSDKRYGFTMAANTPADRLYIFESAIDAMSHASLVNANTSDTEAWKQHSRLSLAGITDTAIPFFLNQHKTVKELVFCLDNDRAGREATVIMARKYAVKGYAALNEPPQGKDYNEDLQAHKAQIQAQKRTKSRHHETMTL